MSQAEVPTKPKKPIWRRWWLWVIVAVVIIGALTGGGGSSSNKDSSTAAAGTTSAADKSEEAAAEARRSEANASASAAAASSSAAAAAAKASADAAAEAAARVPTEFSGTGDDVVSITKPPGTTVAVATITADGRSNFVVKGLDGDQDLLVNTIGAYSGSILMDADGGGTTQLQVTASGPWTISLSNPRFAPALNEGPNSGTGDAVLLYQGGRGVAAISGQSESNFVVQEYSSSGYDLLVNEIGAYQGTVPLAAGPAFVQIKSEGSWSIEVR
jgi:hypothetical protein